MSITNLLGGGKKPAPAAKAPEAEKKEVKDLTSRETAFILNARKKGFLEASLEIMKMSRKQYDAAMQHASKEKSSTEKKKDETVSSNHSAMKKKKLKEEIRRIAACELDTKPELVSLIDYTKALMTKI